MVSTFSFHHATYYYGWFVPFLVCGLAWHFLLPLPTTTYTPPFLTSIAFYTLCCVSLAAATYIQPFSASLCVCLLHTTILCLLPCMLFICLTTLCPSSYFFSHSLIPTPFYLSPTVPSFWNSFRLCGCGCLYVYAFIPTRAFIILPLCLLPCTLPNHYISFCLVFLYTISHLSLDSFVRF